MGHEDDPSAYEATVLRSLRELFSHPEARERMRQWAGRVFLDVELRDSYPYTILRVTLRIEGDDQPYYVDYHVWSDVFLYESPDLSPTGDPRYAPEDVAEDIATLLLEPGDPRL